MKWGSFVALSLALVGCGEVKPQVACYGSEIALVLGCGPRQADGNYGYDEEGREYVTCSVGDGRECILEGQDFAYHCMPKPMCATMCQNGEFVCGD